jgi:hypothetical protein
MPPCSAFSIEWGLRSFFCLGWTGTSVLPITAFHTGMMMGLSLQAQYQILEKRKAGKEQTSYVLVHHIVW